MGSWYQVMHNDSNVANVCVGRFSDPDREFPTMDSSDPSRALGKCHHSSQSTPSHIFSRDSYINPMQKASADGGTTEVSEPHG